MVRIVLFALSGLALAACERGGADEERARAAGQILPGTTSDAMLQTDALQAEAPLADPEKAAKAGAAGDKRVSGRAGPAEPAPAAAPADAASATPAPAPVPTPETSTTPDP